MLPKDLTAEQVQEALNFMERWDKNICQKFGYFFKKISDNEVEIFTEAENEFFYYRINTPEK